MMMMMSREERTVVEGDMKGAAGRDEEHKQLVAAAPAKPAGESFSLKEPPGVSCAGAGPALGGWDCRRRQRPTHWHQSERLGRSRGRATRMG